MQTVTTKTGVLLQKLTFGIGVKGHAGEHQPSEKAATQTAEAGGVIYLRGFFWAFFLFFFYSNKMFSATLFSVLINLVLIVCRP